jgi:putative redox protein
VAVLTVQVRQTSTSASEATIRGHKVAIDRPVDKGGTDAGPMGGELLLAATGGCFMSTLLAAVRSREADVRNVLVECAGTLEQTPARFVRIELTVQAECEDRGLLEKLVEIAANGCIMVNTLRSILEVRIVAGAAA